MDNLDHKSQGGIEEVQQNSPNPSSNTRHSQGAPQKSKTLDQKGSPRQNNAALLKRTHSWYDFMVNPFTAAGTSSEDNKWCQDFKLGVAEAWCQTNPRPPPTSVEPGPAPNAKIISSNAPAPHKAQGPVKNKHKTRRSSAKVLAHKACQTPAEWAKDLELDLFAITTKNDYRKTNGARSHLNSRESYRISTLKLRVMEQHSKSQAGGNFEIEPNSYLARSMAQTFKSLNKTKVERDASMGSERMERESSSSTLLNRPYFDFQDTIGHDDDGYCDFKLNNDNNNNIDSSNAATNEDTHSNTSPPSPHSVQGSVSMASSPSPQHALSYPLSTSPLDSEAIIAEIERFCLKHGVTDIDGKGDALHYDPKKCDGRIPPLPFQNNIAAKYLNDTTTYNIGEDKQNQAFKSPVATTALTDEQKRFWPKMQGDDHYSDEEQASWDDMKKFYKERIVHIPLALNVKKSSEMMYTIPDFSEDNKKDYKGYYDRTSPDGASSPPTLGTQVKVTGYSDSKSVREWEGKGKDEYKISDHFEQDGHFEGKGSNRFQYLPVPTKVNFVLKPSVYSAFSAVNNYGRLNDINHNNNNNTKADDILY